MRSKLIRLIERMSDDEVGVLYKKLLPKTGNKILSKKTYSWWLKYSKTGKALAIEFKEYDKFHNWVIKQHGYGEDGMHLSCISNSEVNPSTLFFLPSKLAASIRPENLETKGVHPRNRWSDGARLFIAKVNEKHIGTFDTHEQAQHAARKAMVARIHAIMEECKHLISKEAYEAIKEI